MMQNRTVLIGIGAIIAVLLQVILTPSIAIAGAQPNFIIVYVLIISMVAPSNATCGLAFVLGLICDLLGYGPVGGLAFLLVAGSFATTRLFRTFNNDTVFVPLATIVIGCIVVEVFYGACLLACGLSISPVDAIFFRALPCALYDCVLAVIFYPLLSRIMAPTKQQLGSVTPTHFR